MCCLGWAAKSIQLRCQTTTAWCSCSPEPAWVPDTCYNVAKIGWVPKSTSGRNHRCTGTALGTVTCMTLPFQTSPKHGSTRGPKPAPQSRLSRTACCAARGTLGPLAAADVHSITLAQIMEAKLGQGGIDHASSCYLSCLAAVLLPAVLGSILLASLDHQRGSKMYKLIQVGVPRPASLSEGSF